MKHRLPQHRPGARLAVALVLPATLALTGCSGSSPAAAAGPSVGSAGPSTAIVRGGDPTAAADARGTCDKTAFRTHAGLAVGSVDAYLWKPLKAGAFAAGVTDRAATMRTAAGASALVARELSAAGPLIAGCPGSIILVNALATGTSLAKAAHQQFVKGTPVTETLAGVNSIAGTVTVQAAKIDIRVQPVAATAAQLAAS